MYASNSSSIPFYRKTRPFKAPEAYRRLLIMSVKVGFREAPPTKKPLMSACLLRSLQFFSLTLLPYIILVLSATLSLTSFFNHPLIAAWTSWACLVVATLPVPIAHIGSYAMTILDQSAIFSLTAFSCVVTTSMVLLSSLCSRDRRNRR
jgi:hypothetical protein